MAKPSVNLLIAGAAGAGKSTLLGHLGALSGAFEDENRTEVQALATDLGHPNEGHAWMLDQLAAEREGGCTITPGAARFESATNAYRAIDTPGSESYAANLLSVASQADIAALVVSAAPGEFEAGVESGRIREVALCCFTMGIKHVLVAVTKLDVPCPDGPGERFSVVKKALEGYLKEVGYKQKDIPVVPVSGLRGTNLTEKAASMPWYGGPAFLEAIDGLGPISRPAEKPLRLPVLKAFQVNGVGAVVAGRVETGSIRTGVKAIFSTTGQFAEVKSLEVGGKAVQEAKAGDVVGVGLGDEPSATDFRRGQVISMSTNDPVADAEWFLAQVIVLDHPGKIRNGYTPSIVAHTAQIPCEFEELIAKIDRKTGKEMDGRPESASSGDVVTVRMRPCAPICVEAFSAYPSLGRFAVRDHGRTVAVGVVKEVTKRATPKWRPPDENEYFGG